MAVTSTTGSPAAPREVSTIYLYLLRATYLLIFVGQGLIQGPRFISHLTHHTPWEFWNGIGSSFLLGMVLLTLLGLRYPLKMLPLLFVELAWKTIWLLTVALPMWLNHQMTADTWSNVAACLPIWILFPIVVPWRYLMRTYTRQPGDPWR